MTAAERSGAGPVARPARRQLGPLSDSWLEELTREECVALLKSSQVGRVAVLVGEFPVVLPVNHRVVELAECTVLAMRTRPGNVIASARDAVAFQVDGVDSARRQGWSVLVRGRLRAAGASAGHLSEHLASHESWLDGRESWVLIDVVEITGRRLHAAAKDWPFHPHAYI